MYRRTADSFEVLIAHPGGPFWAKKDLGAWSIPKGEFDEEDAAALEGCCACERRGDGRLPDPSLPRHDDQPRFRHSARPTQAFPERQRV